MDKQNKFILPITIIVASLILGGLYYASQINKQRSIEKQQQIKLEAKEQEIDAKIEEEKKDYIVERKRDCLKIYEVESSKFDNVEGWEYHKPCITQTTDNSFSDALSNARCSVHNDMCVIIYKNNKTGETFTKSY